jgi:acetyl-CoA carboxylase biotin carboxylase subunit/3-methylcrotonyl-CoA carboxylase alpha subunit
MFKTVLIANRGEVALRIIKTCRRLGVRTVAVYSDADASALHVEHADQAIRLGEAPLQKSYLNVPALLEAIKTSQADAVHPGYGLLSESAEFAAAVRAQGVSFIGPETAALSVFGDKLKARALARSLGIEPPPGSDAAVDPGNLEGLTAAARAVGLPLIVKAAGGGGGIGMLRVDALADLAKAAASCSQRGGAAFGDARVYLERYLERPRHIEVQVVSAGPGQAWALGERECSVQRRHQKLIEEAPSPAAFLGSSVTARHKLLASALELVTSQSYVGLATVEFVVDQAGTAYFLEVNPRLQVEHGITELIFGVDLVELQLRAVAGDPIALEPELAPSGHALEVRLYAEDPERGFIPQPGLLERFRFPEQSPSFRVDSGFREGDSITSHYDPLLAKVMAHGSSREEAITRLLDGLTRTELVLVGKTGPKRSNLQLMVQVLNSEPFRSGQYTTHLLEELSHARAAQR